MHVDDDFMKYKRNEDSEKINIYDSDIFYR